jgi:hypothetical protein
MKGPSRRAHTYSSESGISEDQLPFLYSFEETSLKYHLEELREGARRELGEACGAYYESNENSEGFALLEKTVGAKIAEVERIDNLFKLAGSYLLDIDEEIDKGESSTLKIDKEATEKSGVTHIKLRSADRWAQRKYGIALIDPSPSKPEAEISIEKTDPQQGTAAADNDDEAEVEDSNGGLSEIMANSLYTTFAFLVEAYAESEKSFQHTDGRLNVIGLAECLQSLATIANEKKPIYGQKTSSIQRRIDKAMKIKKSALKGR